VPRAHLSTIAHTGRHAAPAPQWHQVLAAVTLTIPGALLRLAGRVIRAVWRGLGPTGRLVAAMVLACPATEVAQDTGALPAGWILTVTVSGAVIVVCLAWLAAMRTLGQRRWRRTGGRAWNTRKTVTVAAALNSERLDDLEGRVYEILRLMAEPSTASTRSHRDARPRLTLIEGDLHHEEAG